MSTFEIPEPDGYVSVPDKVGEFWLMHWTEDNPVDRSLPPSLLILLASEFTDVDKAVARAKAWLVAHDDIQLPQGHKDRIAANIEATFKEAWPTRGLRSATLGLRLWTFFDCE